MDKQKIIRQLRAKADSTTFPAEAEALRERADRLEAKYGRPNPMRIRSPFDARPARQPDASRVWSDMGNPVMPDVVRDYLKSMGISNVRIDNFPGRPNAPRTAQDEV